MTDTVVDFSQMTVDQIEAALAALRKMKKDAKEADNARYSELGRPLLETLLAEHEPQPSEYSDRVGYSTPSLTTEIDGREYTWYLALKDVKASAERKAKIDAGEIVVKKKESKKSKDSAATASDAPEDDSEETPDEE